MNRTKQFRMTPEKAYRFAIGEYQIESKELLEEKFPVEMRTFLVLNASEPINNILNSNEWRNQTLGDYAKKYYQVMSSDKPIISEWESSAEYPCRIVYGLHSGGINEYERWNFRSKFRDDWRKLNPLTEEETEVFLKSPKWAVKYAKFFKKRFSPHIEKRLIEGKEANTHATKTARTYVLEYCKMFNVILDNYNEILLREGFGEKDRFSEANKAYLKKIQEEKQNCKVFIEKIMESNGISEADDISKLIEHLV